MRTGTLLLPLLALAACAPKRIHEPPILQTGDRVAGADAAVEAARQDAAADVNRETTPRRRDAITAASARQLHAGHLRGDHARRGHALGMTEVQVLAATRTTEAAWQSRDAGAAR
jgi:hypothetical protein